MSKKAKKYIAVYEVSILITASSEDYARELAGQVRMGYDACSAGFNGYGDTVSKGTKLIKFDQI